MVWLIDTRIPVALNGDAHGVAALIAVGDPAPAGAVAVETVTADIRHDPACTCCGGRSAVAIALDRLFQGRVRGTLPWFERVVVRATLADALHAALRDDAVSAARFRFVATPP